MTRKCCSGNKLFPVQKTLSSKLPGLCVDLLRKFEEDLGFTYELVRAVDPKWGTLENGAWNGLMAELVGKRTDMVLSALKVACHRAIKIKTENR